MKAFVFRNTERNTNLISPKGRLITFLSNKTIVSHPDDIAFLRACVDNNNECGVFIDPNEFEVDTDDLTPEGRVEKIRREAIAEYIANQNKELGQQAPAPSSLVTGVASSAATKGATQLGAIAAASAAKTEK